MTAVQAIFLGILQGLTEFLPVSSSGHLVLAQTFAKGFSQPGVLFDTVLHAGTMLAIIIYFRRQIILLTRSMVWLLVVATIPAAVAGVVFQSQFEILFSSVRVVGVALLVTGVMNWMVDKIQDKGYKTQEIGIRKALLVGIFQAVAIIPGISRSGSTIFAGVAQGIKRKEAAAFSFLLSIPAVAGANLLQLWTYGGDNTSAVTYVLGFLAALAVGYLSIKLVMKLLLQHKFKVFALYAFVLGLTTLVLSS